MKVVFVSTVSIVVSAGFVLVLVLVLMLVLVLVLVRGNVMGMEMGWIVDDDG